MAHEGVPRVVVCRLVQAGSDASGNALYRLEPTTLDRLTELTPDLACLLGFTNNYPENNTLPLRQLILGGFVDGERRADKYLIDLGDFLGRYLKEVEDPRYWDDKARRKRLTAAVAEEKRGWRGGGTAIARGFRLRSVGQGPDTPHSGTSKTLTVRR